MGIAIPNPAIVLAGFMVIYGISVMIQITLQVVLSSPSAPTIPAPIAATTTTTTPTATTTTTAPPIVLPRRCLPCLPVPVGGVGYRYDSAAAGNDPHNGMANHTHHFKMHQSPPAKGCRCFWDPDFIHPTPEFSPLPGAVPVSPPGRGGVAP